MFSTMVGSALHGVLPPLQPGHGKITRLRVYRMRLNRPIQTRFRYGYPTRVNLATQHELAGSFFKRHAITPQPQGLIRL